MRVSVNGKVIEFPDDTPIEQIELTLQQGVPGQQQDDGTAWMQGYQPPLIEGGMLSRTPPELQAAVLGAGRTMDKFGAGLGALFDSDEEATTRQQQQAGNDRVYQGGVADQYPVASTIGEIAPYLATAPLSGGIGTQMGIGAGMGAAAYNPSMSGRMQQGAIDAGLSAIPFGIGRGFDALASRTAPDTARLVSRGRELGWNLTPGERTQSPFLQRMEASMESWPLTSGSIRKMKAPRQEAMNRVASEALGEGGKSLADDALAGAAARIGDVFENVISKRTFPIDDQFLNALGDVEETARRSIMGGGTTATPINNILEQASAGSVPGTTLQEWRTTLQGDAVKAWRSDSASTEYAKALDKMTDAVDDLITRNMDGDQLAKWTTARDQWHTLKQLEKANAVDELGNVRGRKLGNNLSRTDIGYQRGANKSDLYDAARLSRAYPPAPDSGTASRLSIPMAITAAATSPVSVPLMAATKLAAGAYANPARAGRVLSRTAAGALAGGESDPEYETQLQTAIGNVTAVVSQHTGGRGIAGLESDPDLAMWVDSIRRGGDSLKSKISARRELERLLEAKGLRAGTASVISSRVVFPERMAQKQYGALADN